MKNKKLGEKQGQAWGVFDDTSDLHRSIAFSDCLISDPSSVVALYEKTGKPFFMQHVVKAVENDNIFASPAICDDRDFIYFSAYFFNGLFKYNKLTSETCFLGQFEGEELQKADLFSSIVKCNDSLVFVPYKAKAIHTYNLLSGIWNHTDIPIMSTNKHVHNPFFTSCMKYDNFVYMFPAYYPAILKYDCDNNSASLIIKPIEELSAYYKKIFGGTQKDICYFAYKLNENGKGKVAMVLFRTNVIFEFNLSNETWQIFEVGDTAAKYDQLVCVENHYWLIEYKDRKITKYNITTNSIKVFTIEIDRLCKDKSLITAELAGVVFAEGFLWIFPHVGNMVIKFDIASRQFSQSNELQTYVDRVVSEKLNARFDVIYSTNEAIYVRESERSATKRLMIFYPKEKVMKEVNTELSSEEKYRIWCSYNLYDNCHEEFNANGELSLLLFELEVSSLPVRLLLDKKLLSERLNILERNNQLDGNCGGKAGEKIYQYCKSLVFEGGK